MKTFLNGSKFSKFQFQDLKQVQMDHGFESQTLKLSLGPLKWLHFLNPNPHGSFAAQFLGKRTLL